MPHRRVERKLTTILSADVVGYSTMMSRDEAGTLAALKANLREIIKPRLARWGGRTVKLMGDGALMEFGSVVDAVVYAIDVQCAMRARNAGLAPDRRVDYRVGINIGDIIVEGDDIYGDSVNVAARLEALAEPGGICLSRSVYNHVRGKLDITFQNAGEHNVKNIPEPVIVYRVVLDAAAERLVADATEAPAAPRRRPLALAALAVALVLGAGLALWQPWAPEFARASVDRMALPLPEKPSLVVLPFDNFGGDPAQDYFADGMTEDLITDLAKLSGIFVISRNTSWTYKGKTVVPQEVAEALGVRYLLEGSVRREGDRVRINAQLIDAIGGHHVWAERYDGTVDDVFALQDRVIGEIVAAMALSVTSAERAGLAETETASIEAYDAVLRGTELVRSGTEADIERAIVLFERALELDPDYARAHAGLAAANWRIVRSQWTLTAGGGFERAWAKLQTHLAAAMRRPTALAHATSAQFLANQGRYDEAFDEIDRAMALAPNDPDAHLAKATILSATGRAAEAEEAVRWALRLNPQYTPDYLRALAVTQFHQGRYEEALATMRRVVQQREVAGEDYATMIAALGHLGRTSEVPALIETYNAIAVPSYYDPLTAHEMGLWWYGDLFDYHRAYRDALVDGLSKAGVPPGTGTDLSRERVTALMRREEGAYSVEGATKIDLATAKRLVDEGATLFVDVRAQSEFAERRVPGAVNLSLNTALSRDALLAVAGLDTPVAFYCHGRHCPYSAYASAKAVLWGFRNVLYFADGFPGWEAAGYPIEGASN